MINFNTENLIIVCYPRHAGGKFLINCLGLSDNAVFQDSELVEKQLTGKFNVNDKFLYLRSKLQDTKNSWRDLDLGCNRLYGFRNLIYRLGPEIVKNLDFNSVIDELSNSNKKFFIVSHYPIEIWNHRRVWPNAKIIYFKNCANFMKFRNPAHDKAYASHWELIRGADWPLYYPKNIDDYNKLSPSIKSELNQFNWKDHQVLLQDQSVNLYPEAIVWDTDNYFSIDKILEKLKNLYKIYDLGEVNESMIKEYYRLWVDKLIELRDQ
jgi:hypothetical protein